MVKFLMMSAKMATSALLEIKVFYTSLSKGFKLKVRTFLGLIPTFVEVTGEKLVGEPFCSPPHPE